MKAIASFVLLSAATAAFLLLVTVGNSAPNRETCEGYPEPRIFLENQSWWKPQVPNGSHQANGKMGHIHLGACVPLYQTLTGGTLDIDVKVVLHDMTGQPSNVKLQAYIQGVQWEDKVSVPLCPGNECVSWRTIRMDLSKVKFNGWYEFALFLNVGNTDGSVQRPWTRYYVNFDIPGLPRSEIGENGSLFSEFTKATGWYDDHGAMVWPSKYAHAGVHRDDIPWDETTGELVPVSGVWEPRVMADRMHQFAYIDPALHALPVPDLGTVLLDHVIDVPNGPNYLGRLGTEIKKLTNLTIDTTELSDGLHWLVLGSGNLASDGRDAENAGVLKLPFLVANEGCVPAG